MNYATKSPGTQVLIWLLWAIACLVFWIFPDPAPFQQPDPLDRPLLAAVLAQDGRQAGAFPWQPRRRLRKWAFRRYAALRRAHRRAVWVARLARLALIGALSLAQLVDLLTRSQFRRQLGALPVLYALLESLQLRPIINRYCPTRAQVDHGTVALVLVLNRLMLPLPLYQLADWLAQTVLVATLGLPAEKFNDDRLGRTLDALAPQAEAIWQAVVQQALWRADVDLEVLFYDLTAFIVHGQHPASRLVDFGFAHNTPKKKRKFKLGLSVSADGKLPLVYGLWSGRTCDSATVIANLERLKRLLDRQGWKDRPVLLVGDRANLDDKLALAYADRGLHYLAGLRVLKKIHKEIVLAQPEKLFRGHYLSCARGSAAYYGLACPVPFEHDGRRVTHRGLVVISGPMRSALRQSRATQFMELRHELQALQARLGQPRLRSQASVQRAADRLRKASPVGQLVKASAYLDEQAQPGLHFKIDRYALWQAMQADGRYLLVTNDGSLSPEQMFARYHQKDGVEKCFRVSKQELKVSPIYLHKDERIAAMLLINLLALLAYHLLERQVRQCGLALTTRRILSRLESLQVIETVCWDGSRLYRLSGLDAEQRQLLQVLNQILVDLGRPHWAFPFLPAGEFPYRALSPPASRPLLS